jgi:probable HAF family extracellular repeat protein
MIVVGPYWRTIGAPTSTSRNDVSGGPVRAARKSRLVPVFSPPTFLWSNGVMTDLGTLGGDFSAGEAISSNGDVVGISTINPGEFQFHAFLWKDGVRTDLGTLGGNQSQATDINSAGQVVGFSETAGLVRHAFIWENGVMSDLGGADANTESFAFGITASGDVIGTIGGRATLWTRHP